MYHRIKAFGFICIMVLGGFTGFLLSVPEFSEGTTVSNNIIIKANSNFTSANGVSSGNGTLDDPFIIENKIINATNETGITIHNTNLHLVIRNVTIYALIVSEYGIHIYNASNVTVLNCTISKTWEGIHIENSRNISVIGNDIHSSYIGVFPDTNSTIRNNLFYQNSYGISIYWDKHINIFNNTFLGNSYACDYQASSFINTSGNFFQGNDRAIYIHTESYYNNITKNTIVHNDFGIIINGGIENIIFDNNISFNDDGLYMSGSSRNKISYNSINYNNFTSLSISYSSSDNLIKNNDLLNNNYLGYYSRASTGNTVINNRMENNDLSGLFLDDCTDNLIKSNLIKGSNDGINLRNSYYNTFEGNVLVDNGFNLTETTPAKWHNNTIKLSNTINGKPVMFLHDTNNVELTSQYGQIIVVTCDSIKIDGQNIHDTPIGIDVVLSSNIKVENSTLSHNRMYGIRFYQTTYSTIKNNVCYDNDINGISIHYSSNINVIKNENKNNRNGIIFYVADYNNIVNNTCVQNIENGIVFTYSYYNSITENKFNLNLDNGIYLYYSENNNIYDNKMEANVKNGLLLESSYLNTIMKNLIRSNINNGINMYWSDNNQLIQNHLKENNNGSWLYFSYENKFYHNSFDNNQLQVYFRESQNSWDNGYPGFGNYWSDYKWYDELRGESQAEPGRDGVGDRQYLVYGTSSNTDHYPLMAPYVPLMPSFPRNVQANSGNGFVNITWQEPVVTGSFPVMGYTVFRSYEPDNFLSSVSQGNSLFYNDTTVFNGIGYYYKITAWNLIGTGYDSDIVSAIPSKPPKPKTVPTAPEGLSVSDENGQIKLYWFSPQNDGGSPITNYRIYKGIVSTSLQFLTEIANVTTFYDPEFLKGMRYYYKVTAVNEIGEGPASEVESILIFTVPSAPLELKAVPGDSIVKLSWNAPAFDGGNPVKRYVIYRGTDPGMTEYLDRIWHTYLSYNDTEVENGVTYYYSVSAESGYGEGPKSLEVVATPESEQEPPDINKNKPPSISIIIDNNTGPAPLTISFSALTVDNDGYIVSHKWEFGDGNTSYLQNPVHTYEQPGTYYVRLKVIDDMGASAVAMVTIIVKDKDSVDNNKPDEPGTGGGSSGDVKSTSPWGLAVVSALTGIVIIMIILFFLWPLFSKRKPQEQKSRLVKEININRTKMKLKGENFYFSDDFNKKRAGSLEELEEE